MTDLGAWQRFWAKVEAGDCWRWTASTSDGGYGQFWPHAGKKWSAHRWLWTQLVGQIPEGLEADHLCRNRRCVKPDHIRIVTKAENLAARPTIRANLNKTHCPRGHEYTSENTRLKDGSRNCRQCERDMKRDRARAGVYNPRVTCAACGKVIRRDNMRKHVRAFHETAPLERTEA